MSRSFRIALAGPDQDLVGVLSAAEEPLANLGLRRRRSLTRIDFELPDDEQLMDTVEVRSLALEGQKLAGWKGAAVSWRSPAFEVGAQLVRRKNSALNVYICVDYGELSRLLVEGIDVLYAALAILSGACKAEGGIGSTDLPFDPLRTEEIVPRFLGEIGAPCPLGLFAVAAYPREQVEQLAADEYTIHELPEFWLLVDADFVEVARTFA